MTCNLHWQELLSRDEIHNWVHHRQVPRRLLTDLASPGVYRFIFPEARDENAAHTPCYVGEAGNIGSRLRDHFRLEPSGTDERREVGRRGLRAGWQVRGSIQNAAGEFQLQVLMITGAVTMCGLTFGPNSVSNPLDDSFLRKMLENWAILASEHIDHFWPLNRRGTPHTLRNILKHHAKQSSKKRDAN